jgi:hypothetical protein
MMTKPIYEFRMGDVDDPYLLVGLHVESKRSSGEITAANVSYELIPNPGHMGWDVKIYDADEKARNERDWDSLRDAFVESDRKNQARSEKLWNDLSDEDRIDVFCAVVRRICKAELDDQGTYRYALYDVFGFGPESYIQAQNAGYMALHNSIFSDQGINTLIGNFVRDNKLDFTAEQIEDWTFKHRYY